MKTFLNKSKSKKSLIHRKKQKSKSNQILDLQRKYGNREVQRLISSGKIQAALKVSNPNDKHEKEADSVAEKVMRMENEEKKEEVQTKCKDCENKESIQTKPLVDSITPKIQKQEQEDEEMQAKHNSKIYRQEQEDEEMQAKSNSNKKSEVSGNIESQIRSAISGGRELPKEINRKFAPKFGVDFSGVKIHNDSTANKLARSTNARAFTYRNHIFFSSGEYSPHTSNGKRLLAHELTHVVQQNKGKVSKSNIQRAVRISNVSLQVTQPPSVNPPTLNPPDVGFTSGWIRMLGRAQVNGSPTDNCNGYRFGFLQTEWVETNRAYYRGRFDRDGSVSVYRDRARPQRTCSDTVAGGPWYYNTTSPVGCNTPVSLNFSDSPREFYPLIRVNSKTGKRNYLHSVNLGFMFVTVWSTQKPDNRFRHFRSVYWNVRWHYRFRLTNFATPNSAGSWSVRRLRGTGAAKSGIISGAPADRRVPIYTTAQALNCNAIANLTANNPVIREKNRW